MDAMGFSNLMQVIAGVRRRAVPAHVHRTLAILAREPSRQESRYAGRRSVEIVRTYAMKGKGGLAAIATARGGFHTDLHVDPDDDQTLRILRTAVRPPSASSRPGLLLVA